MATDGVRYSDFSPLPADDLSGDEKFVGLKNGVNVRLEGDWRGPMADLIRPSLGLGNLASINGSTVGLEFAQLPTPGQASWARVNDDGTVSLRTAAQTLSDLGASSGMSNPMTTEGDLIVGGASGAPDRLGIGSNGQVLSVSGGGLSWEDAGEASGGLYRGPWEDQSGEAVPPYWVDYGGGENLALESEGLDQSGVWTRTSLADVVDSGIATPELGGQSFGNYFKIIPDTANAQHRIQEILDAPLESGTLSFLFGGGGYEEVNVRIFDEGLTGSAIGSFRVNSDGDIVSVSGAISQPTAEPVGGGRWLVRVAWSSAPSAQAFLFNVYVGSSSFPGNGTDGILMTRVQVSSPGARYIKTTDAAIPYTPPTIYELQKYQSDVSATEPGTDETVWQEIGSGGGGGGISYAGVQAYTSADQDGSGNIPIPIDFTSDTWVDIDVSDGSISTAGAFQIDIDGLQTDVPKTYVIHFKGAAIKSSVTYSLPAGWTADWHATPTYTGAGGSTTNRRNGHTYITIQTDPLAGQNANFSLGDGRAY